MGGGDKNKFRKARRPSLNPDLGHVEQLLEQLSTQLHELVTYRAISESQPRPVSGSSQSNAQRSVGVSRIVAELLAAKTSDGLSNRYIETIRGHLRRFSARFECGIAEITTAQLDAWLRSLEVGPRARNNIRGSVVLLFHFAQKHGYLPKGRSTEADDVAKARDRGGKIGILTPRELARILRVAQGRTQLFIVLGAFTGMRSSEILRLSREDINFQRGYITVAAEKSKTATRRLVPILANLLEWLKPYSGRTGALFRSRKDSFQAIGFAKACGVIWPNNALRHSYATYRLAVTADAPRVALEMGNSPQKLMTNYRELADEEVARGWFAISPSTVASASN